MTEPTSEQRQALHLVQLAWEIHRNLMTTYQKPSGNETWYMSYENRQLLRLLVPTQPHGGPIDRNPDGNWTMFGIPLQLDPRVPTVELRIRPRGE